MECVDVEKRAYHGYEKEIMALTLPFMQKHTVDLLLRMRFFQGFCIVGAFMLMASCGAEQEVKVHTFSYLFADSASGWTADFADYPLDSTGSYLHFKYDSLPYIINRDSAINSLKLSGTNIDNGLFMFVKRQISGLRPNTNYEIFMSVRLASKEPISNNGLEDTSGELVYVKVGASTIEPKVELESQGEYYRLNFDKGAGAEGGASVLIVGNIGVSTTTTKYALITRNSSESFQATSDSNGKMWLIVGTDSQYAGRTVVYYTQINAYLNQVD